MSSWFGSNNNRLMAKKDKSMVCSDILHVIQIHLICKNHLTQ
jgi:hypothetical protein